MEFRSFVEISLTLTLLFLLTISINANFPEYEDQDLSNVYQRFGTAKCHHWRMSNSMIKMSKCANRYLNEYSQKIFTDYKEYLIENNKTVDLTVGCEIHNEIMGKAKDCLMDFASSCFQPWVPTWFSKVYDAVQLNCDCPDIMPTFQGNQCTIIDLPKLMEAFNEVYEASQKAGLEVGAYLSSYVIFDYPCAMGLRVQQTMNTTGRCVASKYEVLLRPIYNYIVNGGSLDDISACTSMRNALDDCFEKNQCVSKREINLLRNLIVTAYRRGMKTLVQIENEFGNLANFVSAHQDSTFKWHQHEFHFNDFARFNMSDDQVKRAFEVASHIIQDFEDTGCRANRDRFRMMDFAMMEESNMTESSNMSYTANMTYMTNKPNMTYMTDMPKSSMNPMTYMTNKPNMTYMTDVTKDDHTNAATSPFETSSFYGLTLLFVIKFFFKN